eukprot:s2116_g3.t1
MDISLSVAPLGASVDLVARVRRPAIDGIYECSGVSPTQSFLLSCEQDLQYDMYTFYGLDLLAHAPVRLGFGPQSRCFPKTPLDPFQKLTLFDLCSGIGGFSLGSCPLGIDTLAFLDNNGLACDVLRQNFAAPVIHGSVEDLKCVQALHELKTDAFLQMTGGFPCQPLSRQGDLQGTQDVRGQVLKLLLRCAWLLQADSLLLECVDNVIHFPEVQRMLDEFAEISHMRITKIVFDLRAQWPVRRNRFWCLMFADFLPALTLTAWPSCAHCQCLGDIMPFDAVWPDAHEQDLQWDDIELTTYMDSAFGSDLRVLLPQHQAPTMLHSWGHVFRPCPCGCRLWPLSLQRLRAGGARGFGLTSASTLQLRHLHPEEGALLCTVPLSFAFPSTPRVALCLLGQIAAPLQVLWIQSQFLAHLQEHFWLCTRVQPLEIIHHYKTGLLRQRAQRWRLASMFLPRSIQVQTEDSVTTISISAPTTVAELAQAESKLIGAGYTVRIQQHSQRLPPCCQLHAGERYELLIQPKKQAKPSSSWTSFGLSGAGSDPVTIGLGDTHLWSAMKLLLDFGTSSALDPRPLLLYPFKADHLLQKVPHAAVCADWQRRFRRSDGRVMFIFEFSNHWTLLVGTLADVIHWTHYDGLQDGWTTSRHLIAHQVARCISQCLDFDMGVCVSASSFRQCASHTCGTMALKHFASCISQLSALSILDELELHSFLLHGTNQPARFRAHGKNATASNLEDMLVNKGVPSQKVAERAQMIHDKLGVQQVRQILTSANPWAALKSAASKPGRMFRLVTEEEQKAYVDQRAQSKHGASIKNSKQKKQASVSRNLPVQLDPDLFQLNANHFQDADGNPVKQIQFQDVVADHQGIALCTTTMAKHFLENPKSISVHGLALLLIDPPPPRIVTEAGLTPMVFPALCTSTEEHTIIMGHILQLGDSVIKRKMAGRESEPDKIETQVIKYQIYRDQFEVDWSEFIAAPVRQIVKLIEAMQLCKGQNCGLDCAKFHPGIDESLDAVVLEVWSRAFMDDQGKKCEPSQAVQFSVFMRLPASALLKVMTTLPIGLYVEPRGNQPREQDDKFRIIWLPGSTFADAQHQCRTYSKSLCVARFKNKYDIRVNKVDEAAAWSKLRPGVEFIDMSIQRIYELFPIPHGTQRQAIAKILSDWGWTARALQPGQGNFHHMAWRVGSADAPPAPILTAFGADVVISAVKELQKPEPKPQIYASMKTQKLLRDKPAAATFSAKASTSSDPWIDQDPWGGYQPVGSQGARPGHTHRAELQAQIREDVKTAVDQLAR